MQALLNKFLYDADEFYNNKRTYIDRLADDIIRNGVSELIDCCEFKELNSHVKTIIDTVTNEFNAAVIENTALSNQLFKSSLLNYSLVITNSHDKVFTRIGEPCNHSMPEQITRTRKGIIRVKSKYYNYEYLGRVLSLEHKQKKRQYMTDGLNVVFYKDEKCYISLAMKRVIIMRYKTDNLRIDFNTYCKRMVFLPTNWDILPNNTFIKSLKHINGNYSFIIVLNGILTLYSFHSTFYNITTLDNNMLKHAPVGCAVISFNIDGKVIGKEYYYHGVRNTIKYGERETNMLLNDLLGDKLNRDVISVISEYL